MKLERDNDMGKIFFIFSEFSRKGPIKLNANFGRSPNEILALLRKPMKPRFSNEIIALMRVKFV